jgi:hypothetical protein
MEEYAVIRLAKFATMLNELQGRYPGTEEVVRTAEDFLKTSAPQCGFTSREGSRYYTTRSVPNVRPRLVMFFHLDEETNIVNLLEIVELPEGD